MKRQIINMKKNVLLFMNNYKISLVDKDIYEVFRHLFNNARPSKFFLVINPKYKEDITYNEAKKIFRKGQIDFLYGRQLFLDFNNDKELDVWFYVKQHGIKSVEMLL